MCGIAYVHDFNGNPVNNNILNIFDAQRSRGVRGFGLFDGQKGNIVRSSKEDKILKWLCKYDSNLIMFHHRLPTSTINTKKTAHPFATKKFFGDDQYILVHNGHISNASELKAAHEKLGISYSGTLPNGTFNDSESLLWDFALYMQGQQKEMHAYGSMAFVCVKLKKGKLDKLYFGRNSNPLNMLRTKGGIALSSEGPGEPIEEDVLYSWNYDLKRLTRREVKLKRWTQAGNWTQASTPVYSSDGRWYNDPYDFGDDDYIGDNHPTVKGQTECWECHSRATNEGYCGKHWPGPWDASSTPQLPLPTRPASEQTRRKKVYDSYDAYYEERRGYAIDHNYSKDELSEEWESLPLDDVLQEDVRELMVEYLEKAGGDFEEAYANIEDDYEQIAEDCHTMEEYERCRLLETVIIAMEGEPDFYAGLDDEEEEVQALGQMMLLETVA